MTDKLSYKHTVFLPKTDFPMVTTHTTTEPSLLAKWDNLREADRKPATQFVLHDGPPYANGNIHMGHALNKILKDFVVRSQNLFGNPADLVPGWDCHGLPIEWKVEEEMRAEGLDPQTMPIQYFRARCRQYAIKWVHIQREQFKRLGVHADWNRPYLTMAFASERGTLAQLFEFAEKGLLYRGSKPVMWSPVEQTSLAEAEVEHKDVTSTQVDVAFEITASRMLELVGARLVIWTTTPWTLPVNQALAVHPDLDYEAVQTEQGVLVMASSLKQTSLARWGLVDQGTVSKFKGADLAGSLVVHPIEALAGKRPVLLADFVTTDTGTGVVHIAPDHGIEDFELGRQYKLNPKGVVQADGTYRLDWPWLGGQGSVINNTFNSPQGPVCEDLRQAGALLAASKDYLHSYPHSWRSKARLIYRTTPQWFISVDQGGEQSIRNKSLAALDETVWVPERSYNRIHSMVEDRPDWLISRQRRWGVPIALYVNKLTGEYLCDPNVNAAILRAVADQGGDVWWQGRHEEFLAYGNHKLEDFEVVEDILDVWFDSGTSYNYVLDRHYKVEQADLYLEGSDQHRGWFQASLLASCGTRGYAPFKAVLTHGFVLDKKGKKMAKSEGNVVDPQKIIDQYGADTLRLWVALTNYQDDVRISDDSLKNANATYRKIRNTFRYLLGSQAEQPDMPPVILQENLSPLDQYIMWRLDQVRNQAHEAASVYDFTSYVNILVNFMNDDLSSFYFDVMKDTLYCDRDSIAWWAYRRVLEFLKNSLCLLWFPILPFLAEEVCYGLNETNKTLMYQGFPKNSPASSLGNEWKNFFILRDLVNKEVELAVVAGKLKMSTEARVEITTPVGFHLGFSVGLAMYLKVAVVDRATGDLGVKVSNADFDKCERCRGYYDEINELQLCKRCDEKVDHD